MDGLGCLKAANIFTPPLPECVACSGEDYIAKLKLAKPFFLAHRPFLAHRGSLANCFQPTFKTARLLVLARSYGLFRNSKLDANNFFQNRNGRPMASFKRNQFGPITVPKFYNGEGRTFFFIDYGGRRRRAAGKAFHTVPTTLERVGDFSQTFTNTERCG
jgi:hypothetical protein